VRPRRALLPALSLLPLAAAAAPAQSPLPGAGAATAQVAFSLLMVLVLLGVLAWAGRRLRFGTRRTGGDLHVLADLPLGPRERLLLLQVGDRQALVGVSSAGISSVQLLEQDVALGSQAAPAAAGSLAERMRSVLERGGRA
jgi:flagellar protein FliO/FliZ